MRPTWSGVDAQGAEELINSHGEAMQRWFEVDAIFAAQRVRRLPAVEAHDRSINRIDDQRQTHAMLDVPDATSQDCIDALLWRDDLDRCVGWLLEDVGDFAISCSGDASPAEGRHVGNVSSTSKDDAQLGKCHGHPVRL